MKFWKNSIAILFLLGGLLFFKEFIYNGFVRMREEDNYFFYGFSGVDELFKKNGKVKIYWKEYPEFNLWGTDKSYVLYENQKVRQISVEENNVIKDIKFNELDTISIVSNRSKTAFSVLISKIYQIADFRYKNRQKILAISDVEGNFDAFKDILTNNHIVNEKLEWIFGKGDLVLLGDFFDRGDDVTALLWLCYKLEQEAKKQEGKVHFIIGNHDYMNLQGNVKYADEKYKALAQKLNIPYKELYGKNSEMGRWLRTKNTVIIIGSVLFCHGGISPFMQEKDVKLLEINDNIRAAIDSVQISDNNNHLNTGQKSPLWYRGYFMAHDDYPQATQAEVEAVCKFYGVEKIIVGHTIVDEIKTHYKGRVIGIDVLRDQPKGKNKPSALMIENNQLFAVDELGRKFVIK